MDVHRCNPLIIITCTTTHFVIQVTRCLIVQHYLSSAEKLYVVTTAHTPGSGKDYKNKSEDGTCDLTHVKQLQREVLWLMDESRYQQVMKHMVARGAHPALRAAAGERGLLPDGSARPDVVHIVAGDFNTHLYSQVSRGVSTNCTEKSTYLLIVLNVACLCRQRTLTHHHELLRHKLAALNTSLQFMRCLNAC